MDDFFVGAAAAGTVGRGTTRQPVICAVSRGGRGGPGTCALRVVPDAAGGAYSRFAEEHVGVLSHVRADMWQGVTAGLRGWPGLDQRPFDASDPASSLALVHHVISDFKAYALGTFHGLSRARPQGVCDEFSWRYCHRGPAPASALAADVAAAPHVPRVCFVNLSFHKTASVRFTRQREDSSRTSVALAPILSSPTTPRA